MTKTNAGRFFEDYAVGDVITHAVPRTISGGERALYHALYPARGALYSSDAFARDCGLPASPVDDLVTFHTVFGKTVPDVSLNAVANLGYAEGRWLRPVYPGDTLVSQSEVIGVKQNSNGKSGVVWVRTTGRNQQGEDVLSYVRWVMVRAQYGHRHGGHHGNQRQNNGVGFDGNQCAKPDPFPGYDQGPHGKNRCPL
ncbi:MaoC family dehydratase, partial [Yoonia sp.]|uniref:MaoC family dehydratase n=1 Tax=Yoonia sp. TaxID=2212373 RepID=UPI003974C5D2